MFYKNAAMKIQTNKQKINSNFVQMYGNKIKLVSHQSANFFI